MFSCFIGDFFNASPLVRIYDKVLPQIQYSLRTSYADIGFQIAADGKRAVMVSCLDNLMKSAASPDVPVLNIMQELWGEAEGRWYVVKLGGAGLRGELFAVARAPSAKRFAMATTWPWCTAAACS